MFDRNRIAKDIADLEATKQEIARLVSLDKEVFLSDSPNSFALRYLIIQGVEVEKQSKRSYVSPYQVKFIFLDPFPACGY